MIDAFKNQPELGVTLIIITVFFGIVLMACVGSIINPDLGRNCNDGFVWVDTPQGKGCVSDHVWKDMQK